MLIAARKKRRHKKRRHRAHHHKAQAHPTPKPTPKPATKPVPATAATSWRSPLPAATSRERLFLNRFGTGFTQSALSQLRAAGGADAWLAAQLSPSGVPEAAKVAEVDDWFSALTQDAATKYANDRAKPQVKAAWTYGNDLGNWSLLRRVYSRRSVLETMTDFWSSHLHIPIGHDYAWPFRHDYDATIRARALGTFEDLLTACSLHPAMRMYLDNWKSVRNAPNENQGRELLELHTVGRDAGYTEAMVKDSAKILSGYTVDWGTGKTFAPLYDPNKHTTGTVTVLGFTHDNAAADGRSVTLAYLTYLAHHPATARRLARKLATYFVSDDPSDGLVDHLMQVYLDSGTDTSAVLVALSKHPEFLASEGAKVRTPYADLVATTRVLAVDVKRPTTSSSWANAANWLHGATQLFSWPRPDGPPIAGDAWSSASRLFASYEMHADLAGGWWPTADAVYKARSAWLPTSRLRFDAYVDHLCRLWLGRPADTRLLAVARQATTRPESWGVITASTLVDSKHALASWLFPRLAMSLLDTPDHLTT